MVPAVVTASSDGGVVGLVVFNAADFNNMVVKAVPQASPETKDQSAEDLSRELFVWYSLVGSPPSRDLQKEINDHEAERRKAAEESLEKQKAEAAKV